MLSRLVEAGELGSEVQIQAPAYEHDDDGPSLRCMDRADKCNLTPYPPSTLTCKRRLSPLRFTREEQNGLPPGRCEQDRVVSWWMPITMYHRRTVLRYMK